MAKYRVEILGAVTCKASFYVDAESDGEAEEIAREVMLEDDVDWFSDPGPPDDFEIYVEAKDGDDLEFFKKDDDDEDV
jgi:hypothetical protein